MENNKVKKISYVETNEFLTAILGAAPFGIVSLDNSFKIVVINELARNFLSLSQALDKLTDKSVFEFLNHAFLAPLQERLSHCEQKGRKSFLIKEMEVEGRYLNIKGDIFLDGMLITIQDGTDAILLRENRLSYLMQGQEEERRRLAKEIHDGLGPLISTAKVKFESIQTTLKENAEVNKRFAEGIQILDDLADESRTLSHALLPRILEDFGLNEAVATLCDRVNSALKLKVELHQSGFQLRLPHELELGLYRVFQELLNNILKYAQAQTVNVQLIKRDDSVMLLIEDDGVGFDLKKLKEKHEGIGLKNVETRVSHFNGTLDIDTMKNRGTIVTIEIPIND